MVMPARGMLIAQNLSAKSKRRFIGEKSMPNISAKSQNRLKGEKSMPNISAKSLSILLLLLLSLIPLSAQGTELQLQEVSRFAFTSHDMATTREPVIRYPYVYMPNSYGFQVCLWDSLANTFTEIANYGVQGSVNELVAWEN
jgi:hypothetical protein